MGLSVLLAATTVQTAPNPFYGGKRQGWFWYESPPPAPPPPVEPAETAPAPSPSPPAPTPPQVRAPAGPAPLSAQWFRENLGRYRDAAIDNPSPQNVQLYFYLQRVAMDKSSQFAKVSERVVQGDPNLDEVTQRPTATFGANLANRQGGLARDAVLKKVAGMASLWFFFRSDCPYCEAQAPLLQLLEKEYGFAIVAISLDGAPLPSGRFPNFQIDRGQGQALGVTSTPATFLARPEIPALAPLAQGLLALAQLQERIVVAAVREGWISEEEASRTTAIVQQTALDPQQVQGALPDDPAALLARLRALAPRSGR
ncbi:conjugal transfer protein TraF [uncultured Thiodictyon sp.]|uniref:conjugal transfer protein TraF n=1 Tax=uncultured Thiodictyon sp. TaxID=1846217 RepID=UPI0025EDE142|nr:conjugal transfer protein TraF [uncultured Thiodictyon sp.]